MCLASAFAEEGKDGPACVPKGKIRNADCTVRPGGRHSRQVDRPTCKPICHAALRTAVFSAGKRSALRWHVQRAPSGIAAHCIGTCSALHIPAHFCSFAKRVAPARPTGNATMANERYRNSHYIPFHQLKLCAEILRKALSALYLHPLKPKQHHGFPNPRNTIRHRADRQAGVLSGRRVRRPYALPPIPHAPRSPLPLQYFVAHSHLSWPGDLYKSREKANFASTYT